MGKVLGLTGGIATGKSTVLEVFKAQHYPVVDSDLIAREIVEKGQPGLARIVEAFGQEIVLEDGSLNRKKLGQLIFSDEEKRKKLDTILAPFLREAIQRDILKKSQNQPLVIADIPLLFEAGYNQLVDEVAVVYVPEAIQLSRLMARDHLTEEEAKNRIASQLSIEKKKQWADIIFDNQKTREETQEQVMTYLAKQIKK